MIAHRPEILLGFDGKVFGLPISEAHHTAKYNVAVRTVIRIQAIDASLHEDALRLNFEQFIFEPTTLSRTSVPTAIARESHVQFPGRIVLIFTGSPVPNHKWSATTSHLAEVPDWV
jgi:hypothetical protein